MPMARAAAEIEPVSAMRSMSSALPGPMAGARFPRMRSVKPLYLRPCIREKKLLAADLVRGDGLLSFARNDPVDESLPHLALHREVLRRIDQDDAVLVEQALVSLQDHGQRRGILEGEPGAAIGEDIGVESRRRVERGSHARSGFAVPGALVFGDIDTSRLPQLELRE